MQRQAMAWRQPYYRATQRLPEEITQRVQPHREVISTEPYTQGNQNGLSVAGVSDRGLIEAETEDSESFLLIFDAS